MSELERDYIKMKSKLSALEKENRRLVKALNKYGFHFNKCDYFMRSADATVCRCGLTQAFAPHRRAYRNSGEEGRGKE